MQPFFPVGPIHQRSLPAWVLRVNKPGQTVLIQPRSRSASTTNSTVLELRRLVEEIAVYTWFSNLPE